MPISVQCSSKRFLKTLVDGAVTTCSGRLFHCGTTRWLMKIFLTSNLDLLIESFKHVSSQIISAGKQFKNLLLVIFSLPDSTLYVSMRSPRFLRVSSVRGEPNIPVCHCTPFLIRERSSLHHAVLFPGT